MRADHCICMGQRAAGRRGTGERARSGDGQGGRQVLPLQHRPQHRLLQLHGHEVVAAEGRIFPGEPAWTRKAAPTFNDYLWAPDIHHHKGKCYLYYSESGFALNTSGIGVTANATLDPRSPHYKWEDEGMVLQTV